MINAVKVLAAANAQAIPLFVMMQEALLPRCGISVVDIGRSSLVQSLDAARAEGVRFGLFNVVEGARAFAAGQTWIKLISVFLWGAPVIVVSNDVQDDDWGALGRTVGLTTSSADAPLFRLASEALRAKAGSDVALRTVTLDEIAKRAAADRDRPLLLVLPEPEATSLLMRLASRKGGVGYRIFADVTTLFAARGLPLGGLWLIADDDDAAEFVDAFRSSISFIKEEFNRRAVARAISEGFPRYFGCFGDLTSEAAAAMLGRGNIVYRFEKAAAVTQDVAAVWKRFEIAQDNAILYSA